MLTKIPYILEDIKNTPKNNFNVFSCFHCGGGSTMGYKLAGFNVLGGVEIDPQMMRIYKANHNPKYSYLMGVQDFKNIPNETLPKVLFNLDILDGSPPCSSFSISGSREDAWGKEKKFREGQANQVLDDLFFDFIDIARKLQPKIVVAENVKGLIMGNAKGYVKDIFTKFKEIDYDVQLFLLNAAFMGVPQTRQRTFFIARKKQLNLKNLVLNFNEKPIPLKEAFVGISKNGTLLTGTYKKYWKKTPVGKPFSYAHENGSFFNSRKLDPNKPAPTIAASSSGKLCLWDTPESINKEQIIRIQSFPEDFNFIDAQPQYICGMSVPPLMTQRIANQILIQWLA